MKQVAEDMGVGETFHPTPVGVFFGEPGVEVADPYFGGAGPARTGCIDCGECMTGCRHNAKNTLTKNYLYLAEQAGAEVYPMTTVTSVRAAAGRRVRGRHPADRGSEAHADVHRRPGGLRCLGAGTRETAAPAEGRGQAAATVRPPRRADPDQLRVAAGRDRPGPRRRLHAGGRDHVVVPPGRHHPHRAGPVRQGQQRDVAAADRADRRRRRTSRGGGPGCASSACSGRTSAGCTT